MTGAGLVVVLPVWVQACSLGDFRPGEGKVIANVGW